MAGDYDLHRVAGEPAMSDVPAGKRRRARARRLAVVVLLAALLAAAGIVLVPGLLDRARPRPGAAVAAATADTTSPPSVPVAWQAIDIAAMPARVALDLKSGKYYYDKRFPGNFGLAICSWKQALESTAAADREQVRLLVLAAERELWCQFRADSADAVILLKQAKREPALILLEKMRADYTDVTAPQYRWASGMLARHRARCR